MKHSFNTQNIPIFIREEFIIIYESEQGGASCTLSLFFIFLFKHYYKLYLGNKPTYLKNIFFLLFRFTLHNTFQLFFCTQYHSHALISFLQTLLDFCDFLIFLLFSYSKQFFILP